MATAQLLDYAGQPVPRFAQLIASKIPKSFAHGARALLNASCEQGYKEFPPRHDQDLPYWKNIQPHIRNSFACERLHRLAEDSGMSPQSRELDNHYFYLEVESRGLVLHLKHLNNYQSLFDQITKADYRRQMADTLNSGLGQMGLGLNGAQIIVPERMYVIMFYEDGASKGAAGNIFFVLPSKDKANLPIVSLEDVISAYSPSEEIQNPKPDDHIDLPPKRDDEDTQITK